MSLRLSAEFTCFFSSFSRLFVNVTGIIDRGNEVVAIGNHRHRVPSPGRQRKAGSWSELEWYVWQIGGLKLWNGATPEATIPHSVEYGIALTPHQYS